MVGSRCLDFSETRKTAHFCRTSTGFAALPRAAGQFQGLVDFSAALKMIREAGAAASYAGNL
jgi:hypothetical protein